MQYRMACLRYGKTVYLYDSLYATQSYIFILKRKDHYYQQFVGHGNLSDHMSEWQSYALEC